MDIRELVDAINRKDIVVPEFQREFVWNKNQVKELLQSIIRKYPVGGILLWKTLAPPALKGISQDEINRNQRTYQILLDGQQRCTALYMLCTGTLPYYYNEQDISSKSNPLLLAFNLFSGKLEYYSRHMKNNRSWVLVSDCLKDNTEIEPLEIARSTYENF